MNFLKSLYKKALPARIILCIAGNILIGFGVAIATEAALGIDPFNGQCMAVSGAIGIAYTTYTPIFNLACFVLEIIWGRKYIHIGTFINWFLLCYAVDFFLGILPTPEGMLIRGISLAVSLVILSFGLAVYQFAGLGVAPYDAIPLMFCDRHPRVQFFWARIALDCLGVVAILICDRTYIGIGTVLTALCLGPVVQLFTGVLKKIFRKYPDLLED